MIIIVIITVASIIITINISISFIVLLNCLYVNPRLSTFVHFSPPSLWGGKGGVSEWLSVAELPAPGLNYDSDKCHNRSCPSEPYITTAPAVFPTFFFCFLSYANFLVCFWVFKIVLKYFLCLIPPEK